MKLFRIAQTSNNGYDTFDAAIVAAEDENAARQIHPAGSWTGSPREHYWQTGFWVETPEQVTVTYIGEAAEGTSAGVILASFNAG